jgi:serine/threonine protein kinase
MPVERDCRAAVGLVIGVGEYLRAERVEPLRFAKHDADALASALAEPALCAFPPEAVVVLTNQQACRDNVVQHLSRWLPERARGTELVVIYFAGHGMVQTIGRREEGFLLPYDADPDDIVTRGVAMSDLASWIDGLDTRAVVVFLDCCHAGKILGERDVGSASTRNMELKPGVLERISGRGRFLIASCDDGQKSFECADLGHGLFTFHLLRGIAGAADLDGDGRVGLSELFSYISTAVAQEAQQRFARPQKPWTSATWTEETYISSPRGHQSLHADPMEQRWHQQGVDSSLAEIERMLPAADENVVRRALRYLRTIREPRGLPVIFCCLAHSAPEVRAEAQEALDAYGWDSVVQVVEGLARSDPGSMTAVLDGLNAFEAHPQVVSLLDRLVILLKGDVRNRAILLLERKRLGLDLYKVAALFRDIRSPYEIKKVLGQGLFTDSYLAKDETTGLEVVVRVLRPEFANQPAVRAQFLDLSNLAVHLVHDKLALTREARAFPERSIYFAVRDFIPGVTLQRVLEAGRCFTPVQVAYILLDIAEALLPLHRKGLSHGGIKPSNIFLCEGNRIVLGDPTIPVRGLGLALDRLAYDYRYAAPEMFAGTGTVSPVADFYALGCVAYELLCGKPPFVSDSFHELAASHLGGSIVPPTQASSQSGPMMDRLILRFLARSPVDRYRTLNEVLQTLAWWAGDLRRAIDSPVTSSSHGGQPSSVPPGGTATNDTWLRQLSSPPLLRDESIVGYEQGQSVVNFEREPITFSQDFEADEDLDDAEDLDDEMDDEDLDVSPVTASQANRLPVDKHWPQIPDYDILELLGRGGMGAVYKALHVKLNRILALKVLRADVANREVLARLRTEAKAIGILQSPDIVELRHPNIVQSFGLIDEEDWVCLVLEYVDGDDLAQHMRRWRENEGNAPLRTATELLAKVARTVDFAHQQGILHRDLKPSNILLTRNGEPKVTDFGLAKIQEEASSEVTQSLAGTVLGTPAYMAPEQWRGAKPSPAMDIYALGTILYELLGGRRPFGQIGNNFTLMQKALNERPESLRQLRSEVPPDLDAVCLKCLEKDPEQRYRTAADLADDLERWLRGETVSVQSTKRVDVDSSWHRAWQRVTRIFSSRNPDITKEIDRKIDG